MIKYDLIVYYFCPKTTADSQIECIPWIEAESEVDLHLKLQEWLYNFAKDYWENDPDRSSDDEIYIQERNEDGEYKILESIKKIYFDDFGSDEPFDSDREIDVDFNGDWN